MVWHTGNYGNELNIKLKDAECGSHSGACDDDIAWLRKLPYIKRQLDDLNPENLVRELREYGAWKDHELADHDNNLSRWLWLTCGDIVENSKA